MVSERACSTCTCVPHSTKFEPALWIRACFLVLLGIREWSSSGALITVVPLSLSPRQDPPVSPSLLAGLACWLWGLRVGSPIDPRMLQRRPGYGNLRFLFHSCSSLLPHSLFPVFPFSSSCTPASCLVPPQSNVYVTHLLAPENGEIVIDHDRLAFLGVSSVVSGNGGEHSQAAWAYTQHARRLLSSGRCRACQQC